MVPILMRVGNPGILIRSCVGVLTYLLVANILAATRVVDLPLSIRFTSPDQEFIVQMTLLSLQLLGILTLGMVNGRQQYSLKFDRDYLVLEDSKRRIAHFRPKRVQRTSDKSLLVDCGFWYGKKTLALDSASEADKIEQGARRL
jgi:hypothetical protein